MATRFGGIIDKVELLMKPFENFRISMPLGRRYVIRLQTLTVEIKLQGLALGSA